MRCVHRWHGAAKPRAVKGMRLCQQCLKLDWRNYWVVIRE